jgi:hypothetical protein
VALSLNIELPLSFESAARVEITPPAGENGFEGPTGRYEHV